MTEIEFKLLESLRTSSFRDQFDRTNDEPSTLRDQFPGRMNAEILNLRDQFERMNDERSTLRDWFPERMNDGNLNLREQIGDRMDDETSNLREQLGDCMNDEASNVRKRCPDGMQDEQRANSELPRARSRASEPRRVPVDRPVSVDRRASVDLLFGDLTDAVIGAAIQVHRWLGPGQLESTYQRALAKELAFCGIRYRAQAPITSWYRDEPVGEFLADFIVEDKVILELKVVSRILPVHRAQVVSYLRAADLKLGLILNFQVPILSMGIKRVSP